MNSKNCFLTKHQKGWLAQLNLEFSYRRNKTILSNKHQRGPLVVQRAFYPEGDLCHVYIVHPPGGVVGGDRLAINAIVHEKASTLLTTPGASKFYRSQGEIASQQQCLEISEQASLEYLPQENIYFPGAQVHMQTRINLSKNAKFIAWEIHCLGLPANNERFSTGQLDLEFSITRVQKPLLMERLHANAERLDSPTGFRAFPITATLVAGPANKDILGRAREELKDDVNNKQQLVSATLIEDCLSLRYLGNTSEQCRNLFVRVWKVLRPLILQRPGLSPRIWAT